MSDELGARTPPDITTGWIPNSLDVLKDYTGEGTITGQQMRVIIDTLILLTNAYNGNISLGTAAQSSRAGNLAAQYIQYNFVDTARVEAIPHALGRKPVGWIVVNEKFTARSGGAVPKLVATGEDGDVSYGGGDNSIDNVPSAWDNRMVYFTAEGDNAWLPGLFRVLLF